MIIKVNEPIIDYEGKPISENRKDFTVREAIILALNNQTQGEVLTAENKAKIYQLSIKIYSSNEVELTLDDRSFIKERAGKTLSSLIYGRLSEILEEEKEGGTDKEGY